MDQIILLHGLGRSKGSMRAMQRTLQEAGFSTLALGYPSRAKRIAALVDGLAPRLPPEGVLGFVGHSLGGVLAKHLMRRLPETRRGRIVQLGSPNAGTVLADRVEVLLPILGPALGELTPSVVPDDSDLEIGAIAGTAAWRAYGLLTGIDGENDGKVTVASAWGSAPEGRRIKLPVAHSTMMHNEAVMAATVRFLRDGSF